MNDLKISAKEFILSMYDASDDVCIRVFNDSGEPYAQNYTVKASQFEAQLEPTLKKHNSTNRGIFFAPNFGGHSDAEITRINAQFVECDDLTFEEQMEQINLFPFQPSLIVKTKRSLHCYWLTRNAKLDKYRNIQKMLVKHFSGDTHCTNPSRFMRLPSFYHTKSEPFMVECIKFNPELKYTQEQLMEALPDIVDEAPIIKVKGEKKGLEILKHKCDFIKHCEQNAATLPEHDWYAMITNLAVFDGGDKLIHQLSKEYGTYDFNTTEKKIRHFLQGGTKPMTCATISEKGFKCAKVQSEDCDCKAPAALCFKSLDIDTLRALLEKQEVKGRAVDDIQSAKQFISAYLYNVEPVLGESFILYEIKEQFKLKANDMKLLIAIHKELYKKYCDCKETKKETLGGEIPDWYEPTEKGGLRFLPGALAEHMAKSVSGFYTAEQYHAYKNGVYSPVSDLEARNIVRSFMISRYAGLSQISDAEGQWRMQIIKPIREINPNPYIINLKNGLYNVLDDNFNPHTPEYYSTVQLKVSYNKDAKCPRFISFLEESLSEDEVILVQEMLGYFLVPVNKAQKAFVIIGKPGTGKSRVLLVLNEILLGEANVSNVAWQNLNERFKTAELFGKLANIFADLPSKNIDDNGMFKALVGDDFLTVERKNKDPFSFQSYARLLFSCNNIPRNYGDKSEGFYRRLIILRFPKIVPESKRDNDLINKFHQEGDGILQFALIGLRRLIENGFVFSETDSTKAELQRYRVDSNSVLSFVEDCCELDIQAETPRNQLFESYREYCKASGYSAVSQKNFNKDVESVSVSIKRKRDNIGSQRTWSGIRFVGSK